MQDKSLISAHFIEKNQASRKFDIDYWQAQTTEARLSAVADMVEEWLKYKGRANELRVQRNVVAFGTRRS